MKFFSPSKLTALLLVLGGMLLHSCKKNDPTPATLGDAHQYSGEVFFVWTDVFAQIERYAPGYRPCPAPRALGYLGLSAYECVVSGIPENKSIADLYPDLNIPKANPNDEYYWPAVVNASYAYLMERFFYYLSNTRSDEYLLIGTTYNILHDKYAGLTTPEVLERSEKLGRNVAAGIYQWESLDAFGHNAFLEPRPLSYVPPAGPGKWKPTFPDYGRAVFPNWNQVRRFAITDDDMLARPPIPYSENKNSLYYKQGLEVYQAVKNIKEDSMGAYEARWQAEFWSDDILNVTFSPGTHIASILNQVTRLEKTDLAGCAELYAKAGLAGNDVAVAVWHSKYYYNMERPVDYIRRVIADNEPDAATWTTILDDPYGGSQGFTPSYPAYPSGHAGFGGMAGKLLSSFYEYNAAHPGTYTFSDQCHRLRSEFNGTPRNFSSFKEMGVDDATSRIPLGVNWRMDCDEGLRMGELAAQRVLDLPWKK